MKRVAAFAIAGVVLASGTPASAIHRTACNAAAVHYARTDVPGLPWVASTNSAFRGVLFYWGGTSWGRARSRHAQIFTTQVHLRVNPKVLWVALRPPASRITIRGTRLDAAGSFTATYPTAGDKQFPSFVQVPAAGCWRVTLSSGTVRGAVTFLARDSG